MFILMAPVVWFFEQAGRHPWLWIVVVAAVIGGWLLGREQDYTKPKSDRQRRRETRAQVMAAERAAYQYKRAELDRAYRGTKDRIRRLSSGDQDQS